jgi:hypothetical protein
MQDLGVSIAFSREIDRTESVSREAKNGSRTSSLLLK